MTVASFGIETVAAAPMAAVAARAPQADLGAAIRLGLDKVWAALRGGDYGKAGCNTVYYGPGSTAAALDLLVGVRLDAAFPGRGEVIAAETPAGDTAHAVYFGEYGGLRPAHEAAKAEAARCGRRITGASWEVYGDWSDDPADLRTDVYWLLEAADD